MDDGPFGDEPGITGAGCLTLILIVAFVAFLVATAAGVFTFKP